jgi:hypothetical protein
VNWDNQAQKPTSRSSTILDFDRGFEGDYDVDFLDFQRPDPNATLSLSLTIEQFMTAVNWDGVAMMEVSSGQSERKNIEREPQESTFTLNDFSDLF